MCLTPDYTEHPQNGLGKLGLTVDLISQPKYVFSFPVEYANVQW